MEKSQATAQAAPLRKPDSEDGDVVVSNWKPGYRSRFPFLGAGCMTIFVLCAAAAVAVLIVSDGMSSSKWTNKLAPNVILSGINAFANVALAAAITEGVAIAWWLKALNGATVSELHNSWSYSVSVGNIFVHVGGLDAIALAALAMKLTIVDGILFQRATSTYIAEDPPKVVSLMGAAAVEFPTTGFVVNEGFGAQSNCECFMIGDSFTPVANTWETSNGFFKDYSQLFQGCNGICYTHIDGIGFEIDCEQSVDNTDLAVSAISAWRANGNGTGGDSSQWTDLPIFNSTFAMRYPDDSKSYSRLSMDLLYFQSADPYNPSSETCPGSRTLVQCELRPALIRYPLNVINYTNPHITNGVTIGGDVDDTRNTAVPDIPKFSFENKQAERFQVLSYLNPTESNKYNSTTQLGGIANALSQFLSSTATITYNGHELWALTQKGTLSQTMMYGPPNMGSCDCSFLDAMDILVTQINQLTFLTATGLIDRSVLNPDGSKVAAGTVAPVAGVKNTTTETTFRELTPTQQIADVIYYQTHYPYMWAGLASMLLCVCLVLPSFWRYGELGRDVTLGPMEIASAFRAPMLVPKASDEREAAGDIDELLKQVGDRKVQYGFVEQGSAQGSSPALEQSPAGTPMPSPGLASKRQSVLLAMDEPARVVRPVSNVWSSPPTSPKMQ